MPTGEEGRTYRAGREVVQPVLFVLMITTSASVSHLDYDGHTIAKESRSFRWSSESCLIREADIEERCCCLAETPRITIHAIKQPPGLKRSS